MADTRAALRRLRRSRPPEPPAVDGAPVALEPELEPPTGPVVVRGPLDATAALDRASYGALVAAGLVVELEDGRTVALGLAADVVLAWPLGVVDEDGRPLPYLRGGSVVIPCAAADGWKWWRPGGLDLRELWDRLDAAWAGVDLADRQGTEGVQR